MKTNFLQRKIIIYPCLTQHSLAVECLTVFSCKSTYQKPEIPEVRRDDAEHLNDGCEQDDVFQVPGTKKKKIHL